MSWGDTLGKFFSFEWDYGCPTLYEIMFADIKKGNMDNIQITNNDKALIIDGVAYEIETINEQDHEGHCWLYTKLKDGGEYISYDDGETWKWMD